MLIVRHTFVIMKNYFFFHNGGCICKSKACTSIDEMMIPNISNPNYRFNSLIKQKCVITLSENLATSLSAFTAVNTSARICGCSIIPSLSKKLTDLPVLTHQKLAQTAVRVSNSAVYLANRFPCASQVSRNNSSTCTSMNFPSRKTWSLWMPT